MNPGARLLHLALTTATARSRRTADHSGGATGKNSCRRPARIVDVDHRFAEATDIAGPVAFLCGNDAAFITGPSIVVDGGMYKIS